MAGTSESLLAETLGAAEGLMHRFAGAMSQSFDLVLDHQFPAL
jgi:hypothetical protein